MEITTALFAAYFVPALIAIIRRHHNAMAILILDALLGWTVLGWIAALVWAATATKPPPIERRRWIDGDEVKDWAKSMTWYWRQK